MLDINIEFRKGILFVRLRGILSDNTCLKLDCNLKEIINQMIIRYVVFNIEELSYIDLKGINTLLNYNLTLNQHGGRALLCGLKNGLVKHRIANSQMLSYMFEVSDELGAINAINI